jgi:hypothetical protein
MGSWGELYSQGHGVGYKVMGWADLHDLED